MSLGKRIKKLRTQRSWSQKTLADQVGMTYVQIGRYETQKAVPSAPTLQKLASVLETTTDYLMNGSTDEVASAQLADKELLTLFRSVERLSGEDKHLVKTFLDALITKRHLQRLAS